MHYKLLDMKKDKLKEENFTLLRENEKLKTELKELKTFGEFTLGSIQSMRYLPNNYSTMSKLEKEKCDAEYFNSDRNDVNNKHIFFYTELIPNKKQTVVVEFQSKTDKFIEKGINLHGDKYDYSLVNYIDSVTRIKIICPKHGEFEQTPNTHLKGSGCQTCGLTSNKKGKIPYSTDKFVEKAKAVHGDRYDYSSTVYVRNKEEVIIICPEHGKFMQVPNTHLKGSGCQRCGKTWLSKTTNDINLFTQSFEIKNNEVEINLVDEYSFGEETFSPEFMEFLGKLTNK